MDTSQKILSDITIFNKYAKFIPELGRRENWDDLCERNQEMHLSKFPNLATEIKEVYTNYVKTKMVDFLHIDITQLSLDKFGRHASLYQKIK